ncbi:MAG: SH3 domain-containing protein [Chloroflexi bacterium]|nr:SH3 domain-containing protein [Chloroflexota bacterium]
MRRLKLFSLLMLALAVSLPALYPSPSSSAHAQQPTGSIPTVTGTPAGAIVALYLDDNHPQENVYSGPSIYLYPAIGVLLAGQEVPAYGYSEDRNWIQIYYPGVPNSVAWIYAPYVEMKKIGPLPILSAPPTPTPASTPIVNLNPTLVAAFITPVVSTRLPTFTPPAPLSIATFVNEDETAARIPMGLLIFGFGFVGALGAIISFLRGR